MMITNGGGGGGSVDCSSHLDVVQCPQSAPKPKGTNSDSGCPPTELSCTPPLPLINAGRESYQKPGWVKPKPLPVKKENTNGKANKSNTSCGVDVRFTGQCSSGSGSGSMWDFIKKHLGIVSAIGSILAAGLGGLSIITVAGTGDVLVYISVDATSICRYN
jgi:hypothetical protein